MGYIYMGYIYIYISTVFMSNQSGYINSKDKLLYLYTIRVSILVYMFYVGIWSIEYIVYNVEYTYDMHECLLKLHIN